MRTRLLVVQSINDDGSIDVFDSKADHFQWAFFENEKAEKNSPGYFPFTILSEAKTTKRKPGPETQTNVQGDTITFKDTYGLFEGTVVGILFPKGYILDVLKFKDLPVMPVGLVGQVVARPPGQLQIFYNHNEKRSALVLHIHENIVFELKCLLKKVLDEKFPVQGNWGIDDFDMSISREFLDIEAITADDLKIMNDTVNKVDIEDLNNTLNEVLTALKNREREKAKSGIAKFGKLITNGIGVAANMTKLIDSYNEGGAPDQFISQLLKYESL